MWSQASLTEILKAHSKHFLLQISSTQSQTFIQCFYPYLILSHTLTRQCSSGSNTRVTAAPPDLCVTHSACLSFPSAFSPFSFPSNFNTHLHICTYTHSLPVCWTGSWSWRASLQLSCGEFPGMTSRWATWIKSWRERAAGSPCLW